MQTTMGARLESLECLKHDVVRGFSQVGRPGTANNKQIIAAGI
jgi:hypothetical protein